ncbi:MAG: thioredoxin domain-containing protein [Gammaproteobacteria bacterium]|nr:thioredoxin domain-containing protein [Rhodocyclaceae bacterium]MBU3910198.1 thioredoxin domain-containing protein [Gammaproteobacteria bacterium]MBU3988784.1 thioredoxin domain-containing protein [Gammaproteobacteria bacterium]MBU4006205.1 thioredoxin domain-containing protein [Gammaproteobacteria bacterium]MBU4022660.1 thioredoxin domain-containing protein [Gammaproteobacteria bacterium]
MSAIPQNKLAAETSPYLLQHADNPVAWLPWGEEALTLARSHDKPILLSIGYSACHWCHVMAHESFEDAEVAAVMNELFVNIKVDREERPDLDQIYQTAHQMLATRHGGWPLTMFLTPDGTPFFGGTYFPKEALYGLPGFVGLCRQIAGVWRTRRSDVEAQNSELRRALAQHTAPAAGPAQLDVKPIHALRATLLGNFDPEWGGFGGAPKFPHPTDLAFLLQRPNDPQAHEAALLTLQRMAAGGIYDQLGGGFSRYSVDERWEIPHFEKMLYDNGLLLSLYADAWAINGLADFRRVAEETAAWTIREMTGPTGPTGGFYSSLDADSEGEEGKFYVWDRAEVERLLTPQESALAGRHWGLDEPPNFENKHWHLKVSAALAEEDASLLESARRKLFAERAKRIRPGLDDKTLTSWNALMIKGLVHAARVLDRPDWLAAAQGALAYLRKTHWQNGRLLAASRQGRAHLPAYLDDYAYLIAALLELLQAEFNAGDLDFACQLADTLLEHFEDREAGGFFFTAHDHETLIQRPKSCHDSAMPAGNGVAALALQRLGHLLGETRYLDAARRTIEAFWPQLEHQAGGCTTLLQALEEAITPPTIVILRGPARDLPGWQHSLAQRKSAITLALPNGLTSLPPALAKPETLHVNAWVCRGVSCSVPLADQSELAAALAKA